MEASGVVQLLIRLILTLAVHWIRGQLQVPAALLLGKNLVFHWIAGWVGSRTGLAAEKR
jgi:hypothetical protein